MPKSILISDLNLEQDWQNWHPADPLLILQSETDYEGVEKLIAPSTVGAAKHPVHELQATNLTV